MKYRKLKKNVLFCIAFMPCVVFADIKSAPVVFKSGNWSVIRTIDAMSDKVGCTGIYKNNYDIQLASDALYIHVRGGIRSITLRYGNQPAEKLRLPSKIEKKVSAITIDNSDFTKILASNRLRVQAFTILDRINNYDVDLGGITAAVENIRSGCPGVAL